MSPDLADLRRLHEAATPSPWTAANHGSHEIEAPPPALVADFGAVGRAKADRDLVVAARNALPELLAEVERLRAVVAEVQRDLSARSLRVGEARSQMVKALEYHQEQTRPIAQTMEAIAAHKEAS